MRLSQSFAKPLRQAPTGADSVNANYLIRGGFIDQLAAGIYSFLPLGWRVLRNIEQIIREEMDAIGGQELQMPALHPPAPWEASGRWNDKDVQEVMYQFEDQSGKPYGLGFTHEEVIAWIGKQHIQSHKDLPLAVYQIQSKFRNEPRAKSGLMRGREFLMKDLYSFHASENDLDEFYEKVKSAYLKIYERLGLDALVVEASGGVFTEFSHEFQVLCEAGEDTVYYTEDRKFAQNEEIFDAKKAPKGVKKAKATEVGNIFKLGTRFPEAAKVAYTDADGNRQTPIMASYGIGPSRIMGTIVEVSHDDNGIIWPESVAPYQVHLIDLGKDNDVKAAAEKLYQDLQKAEIDVLYDDREESAGVKFADADLIGIPNRLTVSQKTFDQQSVELKRRGEKEAELVGLNDLVKKLS
jgi:prolyl-tRNA synthetase